MATLIRSNQVPTIFDQLFNQEINRLAKHPVFAQPVISRYQKGGSVPAVNVKESAEAYTLEVAAPGLVKEQFSVKVDNNILTLAYAPAETDADVKQEKYTHKEFTTGSFTRSFRLPKHVNADAIQATYTNGILTVSVPKVAEQKPEPKQIQIA